MTQPKGRRRVASFAPWLCALLLANSTTRSSQAQEIQTNPFIGATSTPLADAPVQATLLPEIDEQSAPFTRLPDVQASSPLVHPSLPADTTLIDTPFTAAPFPYPPYTTAPNTTAPYGASPYGDQAYASPYGDQAYGYPPSTNAPLGNTPFTNAPLGNAQPPWDWGQPSNQLQPNQLQPNQLQPNQLQPNPLQPSLSESLGSTSMAQGIANSDSWEAAAGPVDLPYHSNDFSPTPLPNEAMEHDSLREQWVYDHKRRVPVQQPWIEWGRLFYGDGITPRGYNWFGSTNLAHPQFYLYGDYRTGVAGGRNAIGRTDNWATRLNLDFDLRLTDTERFHAFIGPFTRGTQFAQVALVEGELEYQRILNFNPVTGFFEGDVGAMLGGMANESSPFELPITLGLVPLLFQNGIWMEDAVTGGAFCLPARHSNLLNWSNYDATFFAIFDQLNSVAFGNDQHAAQAFGTAWFIEAYGGYIEAGYAYVRDRNQSERSYHNSTISFTRRYFDRISNSVRVIVNAGQDLDKADRTADGTLLLVENSLVTGAPYNVIPYTNVFVGWGRPQSVARAAAAGGILRNTGINFDTDGLNGFATLDTSASDTAGAAIGVDLLGAAFDRQLLLEVAYLTRNGGGNAAVRGDQYAAGARYQFPISYRSLLRFDAMYGWRQGLQDVYGTRMEYRWKF